MTLLYEWTPRSCDGKVNTLKCRASVHDEGRGISTHQCTRRASYSDSGKPVDDENARWCGIHRPGAAEARSKKRGPSVFERRMAREGKERDRVRDLEKDIERLRLMMADLVFQSSGREWRSAMDAIRHYVTDECGINETKWREQRRSKRCHATK